MVMSITEKLILVENYMVMADTPGQMAKFMMVHGIITNAQDMEDIGGKAEITTKVNLSKEKSLVEEKWYIPTVKSLKVNS